MVSIHTHLPATAIRHQRGMRWKFATAVLAACFSLPTMAGVADDVSIPVFTELRFSPNAIAIVTEQGSYRWSRTAGISTRIHELVLKAEFPVSNKAIKTPITPIEEPYPERWTLPSGESFETTLGYCGESDETHHSLTRLGKPIDTYLWGCETISAMLATPGALWLGSYLQAELTIAPGSGVRVIGRKSGNLLAALEPRRDLADGTVQLIQQDPHTGDVWIATNMALHRVRHFKVIERWYISEQFDHKGRIGYAMDKNYRKSNPWAILIRIAGSTDSRKVWKKLQQQPRLAARLHFAYDEGGRFFRLDGGRSGTNLQRIDPAVPSAFEWLLFP